MCTVWKLHTNTDSESKMKIAQYCLDNNVAAMGWSIKDSHLKHLNENDLQEVVRRRNNIETYADYRALLEEFNIYREKGKINTSNVRRLCEDLEIDDLIWMRLDGVYYLGRYTSESRWIYNASDEALDNDASNQVIKIDWVKVGVESDVPGAVSTSLIGGRNQTFTRISNITKKGVNELSKMLYNIAKGYAYYKDIAVDTSVEAFYNVLSPTECEDLLCMWLFAEYGYVCIPSTNKKSTELYECVLVNPENGRCVFPQVKAYNGGGLDAEEYKGLEGDVWLFVANGEVLNVDKYVNIFVASPKKLFDFAKSDRAKNILPTTILKWVELFK